MDFKKAQEICQAQIDKAELAGDKERAEQLREELKTIQEADRLDRERAEMLNSPEYKSVKNRDVLSNYFLEKRTRLRPAFLARLKETALREPIEADQYGSYRAGLFTFGCFIVDVTYNQEAGLYGLTIFSDRKGVTVPHNVALDIRYKFIPDRCVMCEFYGTRADRETDRVVMYELPRGGGDEAEEGDAQPTGEAPEETKE